MFVTNCHVNKSERYRYKDRMNKKNKPLSSIMDGSNDQENNEGYYPVKCMTCDTHVAMMDEEEVYHFFNTIAT